MPERELPPRPNLEQYKKQAKDLVRDCRRGLADALMRVRRLHPRFKDTRQEDVDGTRIALTDAQLVIAREHGFASWPKFAAFLKAISSPGSNVSAFEAAADAIIGGDIHALSSLLKRYPGLVEMRSTRKHRATLLHYVTANGVEDSRQKTPTNIVEITRMLLRAGSSVNAVCDAYGGATVLELAGSSIHPEQAGSQKELLQLLIDGGANAEWQSETGKHHSAITACLSNGRRDAAEYLAARGKDLNLEDAAGTGRLDVVKSFFAEDRSLGPAASMEQLQRGFLWASEYGHREVVEFLLDHGADIDDQAGTRETCLHWAVIGADLPTIELLLKRGARLEGLNGYGGTALGQALWSFLHGSRNIDYMPVIEMLVAAGAKVEESWLTWIENEKGLSSEAKARLGAVLHRAARS
jgi:Ankyrin repeats (3 copies)